MKLRLSVILLLAGTSVLSAEDIDINSFRWSKLASVRKPAVIDSLDVSGKPFSFKDMLDKSPAGAATEESAPGATGESYAIGTATASIDAVSFCEAEISTETNAEEYSVTVDGAPVEGPAKLPPGTHEVCIKYLLPPHTSPDIKVTVKTEKDGAISVRKDGKHLYGMKDVLLGTRITGISISPSGTYTITNFTRTLEGGNVIRFNEVSETASGKVLGTSSERISWMPASDKYYFTRQEPSGNTLVTADPATSAEEVIARNIPEGFFSFSPTEDFLIYSMTDEGPKEDPDVYQILTPDDRQPGWRDRSYPAKYDLATGSLQRLTWGHRECWISDISRDGRKALLSVSEGRMEKRPTTVSSLYLMDLETLELQTLVDKDGFMGSASFSPDGKQVLLGGTPEAFGGIGADVESGRTPNMTDNQLYLMDIGTKKIKPLTKKFNPSVQYAVWSRADGNIWFTAEDLDCLHLFRLSPRNGKITLVDTQEEMVNGFSVPESGGNLVYYGQGAMNSDRSYAVVGGKSALRKDLSATILKDVELGECHAWNFKNSKGETVYGRYYLPPAFDPAKKYPMIVNYYGGCSPTGRNFESRYPHHAYAALGYVVYIVAVPSGATGNGQKWSSRHVNTAGDGPAQDIIEGTEQFCREHAFVDKSKIGCIGASYGGFMSQYLPTLTDIFACSVSHAGISDHTSYWGFGYWGYSYSEVSMAGSYPWSDKELYVDHSPLYLADKINTPILLIHGDADTNVPFNESIQLFTALKLLGKETALVAVKDQNHHILEYSKRLKWQDTIWAWFAKWLKDDPSWWDALYPEKQL